MTWYDDFGAGTYETKTTTVNGGQITYYDRKFLSQFWPMLKFAQFGQKRPLPQNSGKTISFFRWNPIDVSVSTATLTEGVNPNATLIYGQDLSATLAEYGGFSQHSSLFMKTHLDGKFSRQMGGLAELWGQHAGNIIDRKTGMEICAHAAIPLRADYATDTGATYSGTFTSVTSTTVMADTAIASNTDYGDANDDLNQSILTVTSGKGRNQQRVVTDFVTSGGSITVSPAFDVLPVAGDSFTVTSADAIASGDKLTYANIKQARKNLKEKYAPTFSGGYFVGLIDPEAAAGLMDDSDWKAVHTYKDQTKGIFEGEIGKFMGIRFIEHNDPIRFPITTRGTAGTSYGPGASGGNWSATGNVAANFILGREAFGVTTFGNQMGQLAKPPITVKVSGAQDTSNPLNRYGTIGWALEYVPKGLSPFCGQQIWTYAA